MFSSVVGDSIENLTIATQLLSAVQLQVLVFQCGSYTARRLFIDNSQYAHRTHYGPDILDLKTANRGLYRSFLLTTEFVESLHNEVCKG